MAFFAEQSAKNALDIINVCALMMRKSYFWLWPGIGKGKGTLVVTVTAATRFALWPLLHA